MKKMFLSAVVLMGLVATVNAQSGARTVPKVKLDQTTANQTKPGPGKPSASNQPQAGNQRPRANKQASTNQKIAPASPSPKTNGNTRGTTRSSSVNPVDKAPNAPTRDAKVGR